MFQRAQRGDVEVGHPAEQREDTFALADAVLRQDIGKTVGRGAKCSIAEVADRIVAADPAQGELVAASGLHMPIDRLVGDVEAAAGQAFKQGACLRPGERAGAGLVIPEVRADVVLGPFSDALPFHGWPRIPTGKIGAWGLT